MTVGDRIRRVRKNAGQTQTEFGKKIGLKQSSLGQIESGGRNATERIILLICQMYGVNKTWLLTGEGTMFEETDDTLVDQLASQYELDDFGRRFISAFLGLPESHREIVKQFAYSLLPEASQPETAQEDSRTSVEEAEALYEKSLDFVPSTASSALNTTGDDSPNLKKA